MFLPVISLCPFSIVPISEKKTVTYIFQFVPGLTVFILVSLFSLCPFSIVPISEKKNSYIYISVCCHPTSLFPGLTVFILVSLFGSKFRISTTEKISQMRRVVYDELGNTVDLSVAVSLTRGTTSVKMYYRIKILQQCIDRKPIPLPYLLHNLTWEINNQSVYRSVIDI